MANATLIDKAKSIGFPNPTIAQTKIERGKTFTFKGITESGQSYELVYTIIAFDGKTLTLKSDGKIGNFNLRDNYVPLPLVPNQLSKIPKLVNIGQPDFYIAFIVLSSSQFRPTVGMALDIAFGEIRDTVPPPPPKN